MKVLVTGTDGYIGVLLAPLLKARGHQVTGLDTGYYRDGWLHNGVDWMPELINKDLRKIEAADLRGFDAVAHLAELSNDPLGQHNPEITYAINHQGSVNLARLAKSAGVKRFVYTSSCSAYGVATEDIVSETSAVNPQTAYAKCKVMVERDVGALADGDFSPVFLRNATAYGASPRMRFDIVLNNLMGLAWTTREIKMVSDGTPWRPLVHVLDIGQAIACALEAPREAVHGQIFNVGASEENYRVREIAQLVSDTVPGCKVTFGKSDGDNRSYRVSFDKIKRALPAFKPKYNLKAGAEQLRTLFEKIKFSPEMFQFRAFTRLKQLEHLLKTEQLDSSFFWK